MNSQQFLQRTQAVFDASWLTAAVAEVDRLMDGDGGHDFGHLFRVLNNALHIVAADDVAANIDAIAAAVVFHDVVNLPKNHPERRSASARSAEVATAFLSEHAPDLDHDLVAEAIRCHSFSAGLIPKRYEAQVVADADNLESLGAFGIARTFYVSGRMGSAILDMADPDGESRALDDRRYALDHFPCKLLTLRDQMHTVAGRALADQRHEYMVGFVAQMRREIGIS